MPICEFQRVCVYSMSYEEEHTQQNYYQAMNTVSVMHHISQIIVSSFNNFLIKLFHKEMGVHSEYKIHQDIHCIVELVLVYKKVSIHIIKFELIYTYI